MAIVYSIYVSCSTGNSVNTGFSMVGTLPSVDFFYHVSGWNEAPSRVAVCISPSMPTSTTSDQFYMPALSTTAKDANQSKYIASDGHSVYLRCTNTSVVSGPIILEFW